MSTNRVLILFATAVLVVAACSSGGAASTPTSAPATTSGGAAPSAAASASGATVSAATSAQFGMVLTGPDGKTLYTHAGDSATSSTCTGGCAAAWPPLTATGQPTAGAGVTGQLGTLTRADGTTQVTYNGLPLYYWQGDTKPGDVTGNGVDAFAVATAAGAPASMAPSSGGAPSPSSSSGRSSY